MAVAIIAIAVPALLLSMMNQIDSTGHMRNKLIANWVADNVITEFRMQHRLYNKLPSNNSSGSEKMAEREWPWKLKVKTSNGLAWGELKVYEESDEDVDDASALTIRTFALHEPPQSPILQPNITNAQSPTPTNPPPASPNPT